MYSISQYISGIGIFLLPITGIDIGSKNPISIGPSKKYILLCLSFDSDSSDYFIIFSLTKSIFICF